MVVMLNVRQLACQVSYVMVVNKRDRTDRFFVLIPFLTDEVVANEITQRFRTIGVVSPFNMLIEIVQ